MLRTSTQNSSTNIKDIMVGEEASLNRNELEIQYPLEKGIIKNWNQIDYIMMTSN